MLFRPLYVSGKNSIHFHKKLVKNVKGFHNVKNQVSQIDLIQIKFNYKFLYLKKWKNQTLIRA